MVAEWAGDFIWHPNPDLTDGLFDVCIAGEVSRLRIFPLILRFMKGSQETHSAIVFDHARKVEVSALDGATLPAHGDGETLCKEGNHLSLELLSQSTGSYQCCTYWIIDGSNEMDCQSSGCRV